jgi:hypothetical protein
MKLARRSLLMSAVALMLPVLAVAHPGHGEKRLLSGTVSAIERDRVQLDVFDQASFSRRLVWVVVDEHTVVRVGKARLNATELRVGQRVDCASETDEGPDGVSFLRAVTFKVTPAKK